MKLSKILLGTLLASVAIGVQAQTKPVKNNKNPKALTSFTVAAKPSTKAPVKPIECKITDTTVIAKKPKSHKYCPGCGMG